MRATQLKSREIEQISLGTREMRDIVQNPTGWPAFAGHDKLVMGLSH
jgi:hypothetical protein